jgi:hypothetical protein
MLWLRRRLRLDGAEASERRSGRRRRLPTSDSEESEYRHDIEMADVALGAAIRNSDNFLEDGETKNPLLNPSSETLEEEKKDLFINNQIGGTSFVVSHQVRSSQGRQENSIGR